MKLYLIRHGETDYNRNRRIQGQCDIPLNDYGRKLAYQTAEGLRDVPFDAVFTSPLVRAKETARIVMGERKLPFYEDDRIAEISFGEYEGLCCSREHYNIPDKDFMNFFYDTEHYKVPAGGESFEQVIRRTGNFLDELIRQKEYEEKTVLISTHGCALKALLAGIRQTPISRFWGEGVHQNCAVTILQEKDGKIEILEKGKLFYS